MRNYDELEELERQLTIVDREIAATFPNYDRIPCTMVPWGERVDAEGFTTSGFMIDAEEDHAGNPAIRIGIYSDLGTEHDAMAFTYNAADTIDLVHALTDLQPEGTDWAAWAVEYVTNIWGQS